MKDGTPISGATSPTSTATPQAFYFQNILTTLKQASANAGKPRPQTREYRFALTTTYQLADRPQRFGRRLNGEEVRRMADETKVGEQWRAAGIWKEK